MRLLRPFLGLLALALLCLPAAAQVTVQPSAQKLDASTTVCTITYSSGTTFAVNLQTTATCTPPAGQFVYITGLSFDVCTNGTGTAANQVNFTSTNLTGSPFWTVLRRRDRLDLPALAGTLEHAAQVHGGRHGSHHRVPGGSHQQQLHGARLRLLRALIGALA
jgi:hypothetical protein